MNRNVFSLFLHACATAIQIDNPERMLSVTRRLVAAAPNIAGAHAMHALALTRTANGMREDREAAGRLIEAAHASAQRALRIDPREAKAYVALSDTYYYTGGPPNWLEIDRNLRHALELDPELTQARLGYAWSLRQTGRTRAALEALAGLTRAADPRARSNLLLVAVLQAQLGNGAAANEMVERLTQIYPDEAREVEWAIAFWWEDTRIARSRLRAMARVSDDEGEAACFETYLSRLARRTSAARLRGLPSQCSNMQPDWQVRMLARQGDVEGAYALFDASRTQYVSQLSRILFFPEMRDFRRDARFMPLAKEMGLIDYWIASGAWPDFCSEPDLPYDCRVAARAA